MTYHISQIHDYSGQVVPLDRAKTKNSILDAASAAGNSWGNGMAEEITDEVMELLTDLSYPSPLPDDGIPGVKDIVSIVERLLKNKGYSEIAEVYISQCNHDDDHKEKVQPELSQNALAVLRKRYLRQDADGNPLEEPAEMFRRVARNIASADKLYGATEEETTGTEEVFYNMMVELEFLPNSPTLRGAGRRLQQLSACFVIPIGDSLEEIFDALKATALIHKTGGGTGFSFSSLRPNGDIVRSTGNVAGGPVSFMKVFDAAAQEITQGGVRMGANMGVLRVDHPDVLEFIDCKSDGTSLRNFNMSVAVTDAFMEAVEKGQEYELINPRTDDPVEMVEAVDIFDRIAQNAWENGDPGVLFIDRIDEDNPTPQLGEIESTNPCGEQPLLPHESCVLGSLNLAKMVTGGKVDWKRLRQVTKSAIHFLDNVIDMNRYPLPEIEDMTKGNRKIGLGVTGFADMLVQLGIPYDSEEALALAEDLMAFISNEATARSVEMAEERGVFPNFPGSIYDEPGVSRVRNAARTTIAPNGTRGVIFNSSGGIEPFFAPVYKRRTLFDEEGATETLLVVNPWFKKAAKEQGFYSRELMESIAEEGSIQGFEEIPSDTRRLFVTAHDISPEWHIRMQAAFQKHLDNAVSKTINFPNEASVADVKEAYRLAYKLGCKGITVYRDGSRETQVLETEETRKKEQNAGVRAMSTRVQPRPHTLEGKTYRLKTPLGTAYTTVNVNDKDEPFEVFLNVGKAGSDTAAVAEAIGRLISLVLRIPSPLSATRRLEQVIKHLEGIGGGRSLGFGSDRVRSLPDGVAQVLAEYLELAEASNKPGRNKQLPVFPEGDLCPECGQATLVFEEGCNHCYTCGYSTC